MLRPEDRSLLLEAMRPPEGYSFDRAVGTTFVLDLLSLLVTPLAFTFFDWEDREGRPTAEPLALLEALRRHAERIHLFCQAGMISVPPPDKTLLAYLEDSVFEVRPPKSGGLFHPKVWLLRFVCDGEPTAYRLLCLSRNLTFARSWDTALILDGLLTDRTRAYAKNHPLGEFIEALPGMAIRTLPKEIRDVIGNMASEVRRVAFDLPEGFDELAFWPVGIHRRYRWPFPESGRRFLVMSPFLGDGLLERLRQAGPLQYVISRPESFAALAPESLAEVGECLVLDSGSELDAHDGDIDVREGSPAADDDESDIPDDDVHAHDGGAGVDDGSVDVEDEVGVGLIEGPLGAATELSGLHAKLFVMDDGWQGALWTGSANATDAAFTKNIEFLVELRGAKRCKIKALLGSEDDQHTLRALLTPYVPAEPPETEDEEITKARYALAAARERLIDLSLRALVEPTDEATYSLTLDCSGKRRWNPPPGTGARVWPITLQSGGELVAEQRTAATFTGLSFEAITAFFAFEVAVSPEQAAQLPEKIEPIRFVQRLPLQGAPADRQERILQSLLKNQDQVMRLLLLLLAGEGISVSDLVGTGGNASDGAASWGAFGSATLLESLLHALDRDPRALDQVHRIVTDLQKTPEGRKLIPERFEEIWAPIWQARNE